MSTAKLPNTPRLERPLNTADLLQRPWQRLFYRPIQPLVERMLGFPHAWRIYDEATKGGVPSPGVFAQRMLEGCKQTWSMSDEDLVQLKAIEGPLVLVANHPFGGIDPIIFIDLLERVRPGNWKIFTNHMLRRAEPVRSHLLFVDALGMSADGKRMNARAMRAALLHLRQGGSLVLFPARRVAYRDPESNAIMDFPWSDHSINLAVRSKATLAGIHTSGQNSERFYQIPVEKTRRRGLALCRELGEAPPRKVKLSLGYLEAPKAVARFAKQPNAAQKLRARVHLQADLSRLKHPASVASVANSSESKELVDSIETDVAPPSEVYRFLERANFDVYLFTGDEVPEIMATIGRSRSRTFRAAGQGTGGEIDLTPEDAYYHQLVVWDKQKDCLAGAYRLGIVPEILKSRGPEGLYLDHVFEIQRAFYERFPGAIELSRSFVLPEYQKDNQVLPLLWKGVIEAARSRGLDTLFGSVTISNAFHPASRAIIVEYLRKNYGDTEDSCSLVKSRAPFQAETQFHSMVADAYAGEGVNSLKSLINEIEGGQRDIPPLIRYYGQLGAKFIAYHVEADFADALYCLLRVHLPSIPEAYKKRFFL